MQLTRNATENGHCKYALVRLDKLRQMPERDSRMICAMLDILQEHKLLEYAGKDDPEEAFTLKLKDVLAPAALRAYKHEALLLSSALLAKGKIVEAKYWAVYACEMDLLIIRAYAMQHRKLPD